MPAGPKRIRQPGKAPCEARPGRSRPETPASSAWRASAERDFWGFPPGGSLGELQHNVLRVLTNARFSIKTCDLLTYLIGETQPVDWVPPSRPIVGLPNAAIFAALPISQPTFAGALHTLTEAGFVTLKDASDFKRVGARDQKTGAIIPERSFGFDLSILAVRYHELAELAQQRARLSPALTPKFKDPVMQSVANLTAAPRRGRT